MTRTFCITARITAFILSMPAFVASGAEVPLSRPDVRKALDYIQSHEQAQVDKQIEIAQVASPPFHEGTRANTMEAEFRRVHLADVEVDTIGNVLGWRRGASARTLVVAAHLDTVFPQGTDVTVKRSGARLIGPGLVDDTRGLVTLLALAEALAAGQIQTQRSLLFVADVGEEGLGDLRGVKYLVNEGKFRDQIDAFISIDGDGSGRIVNREMGSRRYRVSVTGPGGHSYLDFGRVNPAHGLAEIIALLAHMQPPASPKTTYNVGRIGGGTSVNSIPFEAWMEFDMRSEDEDELIKLERQFLDLAQRGLNEENTFRADSGTKLQLDAKRVAIRHAISNANNGALINAVQQASASLGLGPVSLYTGSTDSNAALTAGIPAITMDGGGRAGSLHSLAEWFEPADAWKGIQRVLLTILCFDQMPATEVRPQTR